MSYPAGWPPPRPVPPRRRKGLVVGISVAAGVLALLCLGGGTVVALTVLRGHDSAGPTTDPGASVPPVGTPPPRANQFTGAPSACSLLDPPVLTYIYPGAQGDEAEPQDTEELDATYHSRTCDWSDGGKGDYGIRFLTVTLHVVVGADALSAVQGTYPGFVSDLPNSTNLTDVEAQQAVPGYGDEAHLIYGIDTEHCRSAFLLVRVQNATVEVHYGGCDTPRRGSLDLNPIDRKTVLNGIYTASHAVLSHLATA